MLVTKKEENKYTFIKTQYGVGLWAVDWPRDASVRQDWKLAIKQLAERAGHSVTFTPYDITVTDTNGTSRTVEPDSSHAGDWKTVFLQYISLIHSGMLVNPPPEVIFPSIEAAPVAPCLRDGFTPDELYDHSTDTMQKPFLRTLRDVSRSELLRLGSGSSTVKNSGALRRHTTDITLAECACGRLVVAHKSVIQGGGTAWTSCGCADTSCKNLGYYGHRDAVLKAGWREWCTMQLVKATPGAALHQLLADKGYSMDCELPRDFEDFWKWYYQLAKKTKQTFLQRKDPTKPFSMDNLQLPEQRWLFKDPANGKHFKLGI